ncbi:MAG: DUF3343 domain-containing protein [Anaerotruncus sp.]|nr:DUF3343 domain-containing protein [Anaerotruncus sp.]
MRYGVIVFDSSHCAILAQKLLQGRCNLLIMPTPREIDASCGISLRFSPQDAASAAAAICALPQVAGCWRLYAIQEDGHPSPLDPSALLSISPAECPPAAANPVASSPENQ